MKFSTIAKSVAALAAILVPCSSFAQGLKIEYKDGTSLLVPYENLDKVSTYAPETTDPEAVDLGLSVKWASFNIGATKPAEYGNTFMWAGIEDDPDLKYNKLTAPYQDPDFADPDNFIDYFTKYCNNTELGIPDYIYTLEAMDDAATVNWGEDWRMPTAEEAQELLENTTVTLLEEGNEEYGVVGYKFTAENGNSIFLPCAGYRFLLGKWYEGDYAEGLNYWTASVDRASCMYANAITTTGYKYNNSVKADVTYKGRYMGFPVRPVSAK